MNINLNFVEFKVIFNVQYISGFWAFLGFFLYELSLEDKDLNICVDSRDKGLVSEGAWVG